MTHVHAPYRLHNSPIIMEFSVGEKANYLASPAGRGVAQHPEGAPQRRDDIGLVVRRDLGSRQRGRQRWDRQG
ncbi:MAG: hypothetical protein B1H04_02700 [Planctomycetales bacterium 4484_123]|nr:MAG: hypothetical protein B1H04_02700 [Planctomycetales bacterium 4484_123]